MKVLKGLLVLIIPMMLVSLACGVTNQVQNAAGQAAEAAQEAAEEGLQVAVNAGIEAVSKEMGVDLPEMGEISNLTVTNGQINFQVQGEFNNLVQAYKAAVISGGLTEREINTSVTDTTASFVFDGHSSGKAVVLQMVDLGDGTVNVNIRLEDV